MHVASHRPMSLPAATPHAVAAAPQSLPALARVVAHDGTPLPFGPRAALLAALDELIEQREDRLFQRAGVQISFEPAPSTTRCSSPSPARPCFRWPAFWPMPTSGIPVQASAAESKASKAPRRSPANYRIRASAPRARWPPAAHRATLSASGYSRSSRCSIRWLTFAAAGHGRRPGAGPGGADATLSRHPCPPAGTALRLAVAPATRWPAAAAPARSSPAGAARRRGS